MKHVFTTFAGLESSTSAIAIAKIAESAHVEVKALELCVGALDGDVPNNVQIVPLVSSAESLDLAKVTTYPLLPMIVRSDQPRHALSYDSRLFIASYASPRVVDFVPLVADHGGLDYERRGTYGPDVVKESLL
jgi:hypothetical protein